MPWSPGRPHRCKACGYSTDDRGSWIQHLAASTESPGHRPLLEEEIRLMTGVKNPGWLWNPLADLDPIKCPVCSQLLNHIYEAVEKGCPRCGYESEKVSRAILKVIKGGRDWIGPD